MEDLHQLTQSKQFLGQEFLIWLWYASESKSEGFYITDRNSQAKKEFRFWVDDKIALESPQKEIHECVLKGGQPSHSLEAAFALSEGKAVKELKLGLDIEEVGEFSFVLSSRDVQVRSLQVPLDGSFSQESEETEDKDYSRATKRVELMRTFFEAYDQLYARFVAIRTTSRWDDEFLQEYKSWIANKQSKVGRKYLN